MTLRELADALILEAKRDESRPWWRRTTGGLLWAVVLAAMAGVFAQGLAG